MSIFSKSSNIILSNLQQNWLHYLMWLLLILAPYLILVGLSAISGYNCFMGRPIWSDEIDYWREIYSFAYSDSGFGYYGFLGYPAQIGEWGCHGISPVIAYGLFAKLFGWNTFSIVLSNMALSMVVIIVFVAIVRPNLKRSIDLLILYLFYLPILIFAPTSMMEIPEYAIAIVYIALLTRIYREKRFGVTLGFIWVVIMCCFRVSNIVFFIPIVLLGCRFKVGKKFWLLVLMSLLLSFACYFGFSLFNAGYPYGFLVSLSEYSTFIEKINVIAGHFVSNIILFFGTKDDLAQVIQRYLYFLILTLSLISIIICHQKSKKEPFKSSYLLIRNISLIVFLVLTLYLAIVLAAYDVFSWRDYRTLAPVLWSQILLLITLLPNKKSIDNAILAITIFVTFIPLLFSGRIGFEKSGALDNSRFTTAPIESSYELDNRMSIQGENTDDRTVITYGSTPEWVSFSLPPEFGMVGVLTSKNQNSPNPIELEPRMAYIVCSDPNYEFAGYELDFTIDDLNFYKRIQ